jgi:dTDP-4-dehydrorhamnose 3,5-epimerase
MELQQAKRDVATVTPRGQSLAQVPDGVTFYDLTAQIDERGSVREMYDLRWNWHGDPLVFVYCFTIRPGLVKGWGMHKQHEDRYYVLSGEMEAVLYDERETSPTRGLVAHIILSQYQPRLMNIPAGVWHADRNLGSTELVVINFPTIPYDHANPDKYRLPLDTDRIPYKFKPVLGW